MKVCECFLACDSSHDLQLDSTVPMGEVQSTSGLEQSQFPPVVNETFASVREKLSLPERNPSIYVIAMSMGDSNLHGLPLLSSPARGLLVATCRMVPPSYVCWFKNSIVRECSFYLP